MKEECIELFRVIKSGDVERFVQLIGDEKCLNVINLENEEGKTAFQVALETEKYEIARILMENGIQLNTILLRMIEGDIPAAVTFICENKDKIEEFGQNIMDSPSESHEYSMETTPIILAAEKNNYHIVKILLTYGATMPSYEELKSKYSHLPTTQLTRIIYRYYNAISSEAYLLQTNGNLVTDIFNLFKDIKRAKREKKGMNDEFETLTDNLEAVSRTVLDLTRNEDEVRYLLTGDQIPSSSRCIQCSQHIAIPPVIKEALLFNVKGVTNHGIWFVKFVLNTASQNTFLGLLIFSTIRLTVNKEDVTDDRTVTDEDIRAGYLSYRDADIHNIPRVCIFLWILGMTVRELNDVRRLGRKMYLKIACSIPDILQLVLYWIYIVMSFVAIVMKEQGGL
ncbi:transient receptor potential protein-like [Amphiura filiformis]|uniref:transient receptor potential protein-like n=1 Tax=Amphiura filiformis TaxID=82378 RepID=UPI003B228211